MDTSIDKYKEEIINTLNALKTDAEMALDGDWDCTTDEGMEGFSAQIKRINKLLKKLTR